MKPHWVWEPWHVHVKLFGVKRDPNKCAHAVPSRTRDPLSSQCTRKPVTIRDGYPICRMHDNKEAQRDQR